MRLYLLWLSHADFVILEILNSILVGCYVVLYANSRPYHSFI